jgi:hypothetical protein
MPHPHSLPTYGMSATLLPRSLCALMAGNLTNHCVRCRFQWSRRMLLAMGLLVRNPLGPEMVWAPSPVRCYGTDLWMV